MAEPTAKKPAASKEESQARSGKYIIVAAAFAAFLATFNETFLNVGFAPIGEDLGIGLGSVQWLATAYMLAAAIMVPIAAFAYRSIPTRKLYCATVSLLIIGSIIGFFAPNFTVLLVGRIVQAIGTGMLIPVNMSITLDTAPRGKLGTYMGIMGSMTTLGPSLSIILAGVLLSFFPWRALMLVFGVLSAICLIVGAVVLRDVANITKPKLDTASAILVSCGLALLLYGISTVFGGQLLLAAGCMIVGVILIALFALRQGKLETPLVNLRPLKVPAFAIGVVLNMIALIVMFAMNIITPTFIQSVLGKSSLTASLILFPAILLSSVVSPLAGRIYDKRGPRILLPAGFALIAIFSLLLALFIGSGSMALLAVLYIPIICGCALVIGPVQSFALSRLSWDMNPHGTTVMSVGFQIAGSLGSSLFTGIYSQRMAAGLAQGANMTAAGCEGFLAASALGACLAVCGVVLALVEGRFAQKSATAKNAAAKEQATKKQARPAAAQAKAAASSPAALETLDSRAAAYSREFSTSDSGLPFEYEAPSELEGGIARSSSAPFRIEAVMKSDVYCVSENDSVLDALRFFLEKGISGAPVVNTAGECVGIITDGDIMRNLARQHTEFKSAYSFMVEVETGNSLKLMDELVAKRVSEVATKNVLCADVNASLADLCQMMAEHHFNKVPVTQDGAMVGVINRTAVTRYVVGSYLDSVADAPKAPSTQSAPAHS